MSALPRLWQRWVRRLAHREPATPLALLRIAVGLIVVHTFVMMILTDSVTPIWVDRDHGGIHPIQSRQWLISALGGATPPVVWGLVWTGILAGVGVATGTLSRASALLAGQVCIALFGLLPGAGGGHDRVITNALWLLVLAPAGATLSVDARVRTGRWRDATPVAAWPRYLVVVQLCLIYSMTGIQKLGSSWFPWGDYSAVYYALLTPSWARFDLSAVAWVFPLTQLGTAVTWIWEVSFPMVVAWLWWRHTRHRGGRLRRLAERVDLRAVYVVIGVTMHVTLFTLMELGPFSLITMSLYIALWHHDELVRRWPRLGPPSVARPASGAPAPVPAEQTTQQRGTSAPST